MNSPTPFSSNDDPSDFGDLLDDSESRAQRQREGLPDGFRMRASSHYVDQLETAPRPTLRPIAVSSIEPDSVREASEALVSSVRVHGVLEPLLVQHDPRGRQYRLIAGRKRLAAARAAGLREVPCIVHTVSDAEAAELMAATHEPVARDVVSARPAPDVASSLYPAQRELESALSTIDSCSPLLNQSSALARRGGAQVIAVECRRAHRMLKAMQVLTNTVPVRRAPVRPANLFRQLREAFQEEQRILGSEPVVTVAADPQLAFYGDEELLLVALSSALTALGAAANVEGRELSFTALVTGSPTSITLELVDHSLVLSDAFVRTAFTSPWPVQNGDSVLMQLQAARAIALAHGGSVTLAGDALQSTVRFQLPTDQSTRHPKERTAN